MNTDPCAAARLAEELPHLDWITDAQRVGRLSQDFAWFSPVLKRQLADKRGDDARRWLQKVIDAGAPQAPAAQAKLKELS